MPPKKKLVTTFTLEQALDYIDGLANAKGSKLNWTNALATLVHYHEAGDLAFPTVLSKKEMADQYADVNIVPIINNVDNIIDIIDNKIKSSRNDNPIATDTRKQYYLSILRLTQKKSPMQIVKQKRDVIDKKLKEMETLSNQQRNQNKPKRANEKYPDFTWMQSQKEFEEFITTRAFTNTDKGRKDLRSAVIVGLYILQRPRRVADYASLQYFSKKPNERELKDRNIVYAEGDKLFFSIDKFKTRTRVTGASNEAKELLPRYEKELAPRLASLMRDYIKKWEVKDMSKLTSEEKRQKRQYYVFYKETGTYSDAYDDNSFSKYISGCMKRVFNNRKELSVNTMRHNFNTWLSENIQHFNDAQLKEISIDVGDTPREMATNLRYRIQLQENADMEKTQIEGNIYENNFIGEMVRAQAEEEGSVGNAPSVQDVEEVNQMASPVPHVIVLDDDVDALYLKLGKAYVEVETIKAMISRKLGLAL